MTGLTDDEREAQGVHCVCGHRVIWHHDTRGCGYHGFSDKRCPCQMPSDAVVGMLIAGRVAGALAGASPLDGLPVDPPHMDEAYEWSLRT